MKVFTGLVMPNQYCCQGVYNYEGKVHEAGFWVINISELEIPNF